MAVVRCGDWRWRCHFLSAPGRHGANLERKKFEQALMELEIELVKLQLWVKHEGLKVVIVLEGRECGGQRGHHQADYGARQPPAVSRHRPSCAGCRSDRSRTDIKNRRDSITTSQRLLSRLRVRNTADRFRQTLRVIVDVSPHYDRSAKRLAGSPRKSAIEEV